MVRSLTVSSRRVIRFLTVGRFSRGRSYLVTRRRYSSMKISSVGLLVFDNDDDDDLLELD